jgi:AcrR family transcriptional regulator
VREALLDAAVALFAEHGVAATSAVDIARRAGVTPAMVHYYFRGRDRLLDAVVDERMARFVAMVFASGAGGAPPAVADLLPAIVARIFDAARRMPWLPPLWIREIAAEGGQLRERALRHLPRGAIGAVVDAMAAAQRRGLLRAGVEPRAVFLSMIGLTLFPLATQTVWRRLPGTEGVTLDDLQRHATAVLSAGLFEARAPLAPPSRRKPR